MERITKAYVFLAVTTFTSLTGFVVLNVVLGALFFVRDRINGASGTDNRVSAYRERFADYQAYARTSRADAIALLDEQDAMGNAGLQYDPWLQFRNPSVGGRFLNTDERGYRLTRKPELRFGEPFKVYVFGGSTTFGYGVADEDTIPSYLQKILEKENPAEPILVRNFGQAFYYSSQEQLQLLALLKDGGMPGWAVFVDGGNDTAQLALEHDEPVFTPAVRRLWSDIESRKVLLPRLPIERAARAIAKRLRPSENDASAQTGQHRLIFSDSHLSEAKREEIVNYVVSRYLANVRITRAVCREFGVRCLFVWQPHPAYKYNRQLHKTFPFEGPVPDYFVGVYSRLERHRSPDFLFLGDLTENRTERSYVDDVHYNETINEQIAERIAHLIRTDPVMVPTGSKP